MKRLIYFFVLLSTNITIAYSSLAVDSLPDWVKNVTSEEEYRIWQEYLRYYDKTDLKKVYFLRTPDFPPEQKELEYRKLLKKVKEAKSDSTVRVSSVSNVLYASPFKKELVGDTVKISGRVYSNLDGYDAHLIAEISYDKKSKEPLDFKISGYSFNGTPVAFKPMADNGMSRRVSMEQITQIITQGTLPAESCPREVTSQKISLTPEQKEQLDDIMTDQAQYPWVSNQDKIDDALAVFLDSKDEAQQKKRLPLYNKERDAFNGIVQGTMEFVLPNGEINHDDVLFTFFIDAEINTKDIPRMLREAQAEFGKR